MLPAVLSSIPAAAAEIHPPLLGKGDPLGLQQRPLNTGPERAGRRSIGTENPVARNGRIPAGPERVPHCPGGSGASCHKCQLAVTGALSFRDAGHQLIYPVVITQVLFRLSLSLYMDGVYHKPGSITPPKCSVLSGDALRKRLGGRRSRPSVGILRMAQGSTVSSHTALRHFLQLSDCLFSSASIAGIDLALLRQQKRRHRNTDKHEQKNDCCYFFLPIHASALLINDPVSDKCDLPLILPKTGNIKTGVPNFPAKMP